MIKTYVLDTAQKSANAVFGATTRMDWGTGWRLGMLSCRVLPTRGTTGGEVEAQAGFSEYPVASRRGVPSFVSAAD